MNYMRVIAFMFITLNPLLNIADAAIAGDAADFLQIRAGEHSGFMRIVIEGQDSILSGGKVSQQGKDIIVSFAEKISEIKKKDLPIKCKVDKDVVTFSLKQAGRLKTYSLQNPSRFVIDVYPKEEEVINQAKTEKKPEIEKAEKIKTNAATKNPSRFVMDAHAEEKEVKKQVKTETKPEAGKAEIIKTGIMTEASSKGYAYQRDRNVGTTTEKEYDEINFIPEKYKAMWSLLEGGNFYAVLKELPAFKPDKAESLAAFYYIFAKANIMAKQYLDAVKHLRLAYIYATENALKEQALLKRAGMYMELKLIYEARADYLVFIRDFPSSRYIEKAHFGLAESLSRIGSFSEAIEHYKQAGKQTGVLFGMANTLQKIDRVEEAKKAYNEALLVENTYPASSPETYFLIGENMRMSGDMENAKKQLSLIGSGPFKDNASISMGLIAMEESNIQEAVGHFSAAAQSKEQKVRVQALFNLSLAYIKEGKVKEATSSLEEIRHHHIDSNMYKEALLALAKIYKKGSRGKEAVSLLKELVYGKQPPADAFSTLEEIVLETGEKSSTGGLTFVTLWNDVGQWLVDETREEFLLKVVKRLRHEGKPFIDLCSWLVENGSQHARGKAAADLADYYIGTGNAEISRDYINIAKDSKESGDAVLRVEARVLHMEGNQTAALKQIIMIKEIEKSDLDLLGNIISGINDPGSKEVQKAIAFYEKALNESDGDAENYAALADILYANNDRSKSLKYYRIAKEKSPDNEWVMYRVARDAGMPEAEDILNRLQKGDNLYGRLAKSKLTEMALLNKVKEMY